MALKQHDLTSLQPLEGELKVLVTFDYTPAERGDSTSPGHPGSVFVTGVTINGHEVDAAVFDRRVLERWEADLLLEREEEVRFEREYEDLRLAEVA